MKILRTLFVVVFVSCLFAVKSNAQAVVYKDNIWRMSTPHGMHESVDFHMVITPNGNVNCRVNWELPKTDPVIQAAISGGKYTRAFYIPLFIKGKLCFAMMEITYYPNGNVRARAHSST